MRHQVSKAPMTYSFTTTKFYKRIKIVNQLSRRITNSLFSLECFLSIFTSKTRQDPANNDS